MGEHRLAVVIEMGVEEVRADFTRLKNTLIYTMLQVVALLLIIMLIASVFFGKSIAAPVRLQIQKLTKASAEVIAVSDQISQKGSQLSSSSSEQTSATHRTVASIEQISSMITQTKEFSAKCQTITKGVSEKTAHGDAIMNELSHSMEQIRNANLKLKEMEGIINDISVKTNVINDIVFKTQLLSFNASIEAARAGQHGRGFAVVAEEVGNLANMSGNAAKEISGLLNASKQQVQNIVESTQSIVKRGQEVTESAITIFRNITVDIKSIFEHMNHIVEASVEQDEGARQTLESMKQLSDATDSNNQVSSDIIKNSDKLAHVNDEIELIVRALGQMVKITNDHNLQDNLSSKGEQVSSSEQDGNVLQLARNEGPVDTSEVNSTKDGNEANEEEILSALMRKSKERSGS